MISLEMYPMSKKFLTVLFLTAPNGELTVSKQLAHSSPTDFLWQRLSHSSLTADANEALSQRFPHSSLTPP